MARREEPAYRSARERADKHTSGFESTTVNVPEGMKRFKLKSAGTKIIDILPYRVGEGNPFAKPGELHYERTFHTHKGIGPNEDSYVCPAKTKGDKCPICEYRAKLSRNPDADEDLVKSLRPSERQLFLVIDHADREAGPQIWDISYHLFGKVLDSTLKNSDEEDGFDLFYHLTKGLSLKLMVQEKSMGRGKPFYFVESILFKQRKEQYSADMLDELPCLDDLLIIKPYKELQAILMHTDADEVDKDDADDEPKGKRRPVDDDEDEAPKGKKSRASDDEEDEDEPKSKRRASDEEDEEEKPKGKGKKSDDEEDEDEPKSSKKSSKDEDDWDEDEEPKSKKSKASDEDEEDEEDEPKSKKSKASDDEDEDEKPKGKKPAKDDDDWDDDDEPKGKSKSKASDEDEEDEKPKSKKSKSDDDEDEEEKPKGKSSKKSKDDDDWDED